MTEVVRGNPVLDPQEALGQSEAFLAFQEQLSRVAVVDRPVLIVGERGTGKELAARRLHFLSRRWQEPLVELNCSALAASLIESELFGYEAGAFTGATRRRQGRFEAANGGTLFLDELGNIPLEVQEKVLRVVEYGSFARVGSPDPVRVEVRIVGATNVDLRRLVAEGQFMPDLLDRLSFEVLYLPPLRERREDILLLANHFASRMAYELGRQDLPEFNPNVCDALEQYAWPGNIREMKNVIERAVYRATSARINEIEFDPFRCLDGMSAGLPALRSAPESPAPAAAAAAAWPQCFKTRTQAFELELLRQALAESRHNQRRCAELLNLSYYQFRALYRKYQAALRG